MAGSGGLLSFTRDPTSGALAQLAGEQGCHHRAASGCGRARSLGFVTPLGISRDGSIVVVGTFEYLFGSRIDSVLVLARDSRSGALTQLDGAAGCVERKGRDGCSMDGYLYDTVGVTVSPDATRVFAANDSDNHLTLYSRESGGALARAGCFQFSQSPDPGCKAGPPLPSSPTALVVTADGRTLYAASQSGIHVFNLAGGRFDQLPGAAGCPTGFPTSGCGAYRRSKSFAPYTSWLLLAASPDGKRLYTAHGGLLTFARRPDGTLLSSPARRGARARCVHRAAPSRAPQPSP